MKDNFFSPDSWPFFYCVRDPKAVPTIKKRYRWSLRSAGHGLRFTSFPKEERNKDKQQIPLSGPASRSSYHSDCYYLCPLNAIPLKIVLIDQKACPDRKKDRKSKISVLQGPFLILSYTWPIDSGASDEIGLLYWKIAMNQLKKMELMPDNTRGRSVTIATVKYVAR